MGWYHVHYDQNLGLQPALGRWAFSNPPWAGKSRVHKSMMTGERDESMTDNELIGNLITVHKLWFVLSGNHRPVQRHQHCPGIKMANGVSRSLAALAVTLRKCLG